jgi:S-sulfo-L-cysteine synthase (O-acetyl-L-serine-dependent)
MPTPTLTPVSLLDTIGRTPLLRLERLAGNSSAVEIYAKAEFQNPGGSVKDRAAAAIVRDAERSGRLQPGGTILDATSGNTGIAFAMIAAARGYRLKLCVPGNVTAERLRTLRAYGADVVMTNPMEGTDGAIREARRLHAEAPEKYFYADQYNNDSNWRAHYDTTAVEILEQTDGRVTHFVAGLGTSGTFMGTGRRLRAFRHDIRLISVQPESPLNGIEGLKHMETAIRPGIYDDSLADEDVRISTERAYAWTRRLATEEGLLGAGGNARCGGANPRGRNRDSLSRQRHTVPDGELLGSAPNEELDRRRTRPSDQRAFRCSRTTGDQETRSCFGLQPVSWSRDLL